MNKHKKNDEVTTDTPTGGKPTAIGAEALQEVEQLQTELQEVKEQNEQLFRKLHAKQAELEEATKGSKALREILTEEKRVLQSAAETARNCLAKRILPAHKWMEMGQMEAYEAAAARIEEALKPTVVSPPPSEGFLKAQRQIADLITRAAEQYIPVDSDGGPGLEKGHEFPPVPCPFCPEEPAKNWLSRHIKDNHPRRFDKWERERQE